MKGLWRKRQFAVAVAIVIVLWSVPYGAHRSLSEAAEPAEILFYQGADRDGVGVQSDLSIRSGQAANLLVVADRYMEPTLDVVKNLQEARNALENASTISEKAAANASLTIAAEAMYLALGDHILSASDQRYVAQIRTEMESSSLRISHDPYNTVAETYNQEVLGRFPANLLKHIAFVEELATFR